MSALGPNRPSWAAKTAAGRQAWAPPRPLRDPSPAVVPAVAAAEAAILPPRSGLEGYRRAAATGRRQPRTTAAAGGPVKVGPLRRPRIPTLRSALNPALCRRPLRSASDMLPRPARTGGTRRSLIPDWGPAPGPRPRPRTAATRPWLRPHPLLSAVPRHRPPAGSPPSPPRASGGSGPARRVCGRARGGGNPSSASSPAPACSTPPRRHRQSAGRT